MIQVTIKLHSKVHQIRNYFMLGDVFLVHHFFPIPAFQCREDISKRKKLSQVHTYTYCTVVETHRFAFHDL